MNWGGNVGPLHLKVSDFRYKYNNTRVTHLLQFSSVQFKVQTKTNHYGPMI